MSLESFHPDSCPLVHIKYFVLSCSVSWLFSLSSWLCSDPASNGADPWTAFSYPARSHTLPVAEPKWMLTGWCLSNWRRTADTCFIANTATSQRSSDSAKRFLSIDVLVYMEHTCARTHTHYQQLIALNVLTPLVGLDIWLPSCAAQQWTENPFYYGPAVDSRYPQRARPLWQPGWRRPGSRGWHQSTAGWRSHQKAGDRTWPILGWWGVESGHWAHPWPGILLPWH